MTYVLENSFNRVHTLREPVSIKYFARELFAYFVGSLKVNEGLSDASKFWNKIEDIIKISERLPKTDIIEWVIKNKE